MSNTKKGQSNCFPTTPNRYTETLSSHDASFVPWITDLRQTILTRFPLPTGLFPVSDDVLLPPKWLLSMVEDLSSLDASGAAEPKVPSVTDTLLNTDRAADDRIVVELEENKRMTPNSHWQDVRHLVFTSNLSASYGPGDVLTIYPQNSTEEVDLLIDRMRWKGVADKLITFSQATSSNMEILPSSPSIEAHSGDSPTFRQLLMSKLDLMAIPRRSFFSMIAHFTDDQFQKDRLLEFTKPEYIDELYDYTTRPRRSILEVLQEFDTVKIPWQWAANVLPELRGRQFSIASGGELKGSTKGFARFELLVAIVKYKTLIKKIREGVCTRYLSHLKPGARLSVTLQKGSLGVTKEQASKPVIMIAPGTGVAPMRSLIWERLQRAEELADSAEVQPTRHTSNGLSTIGQTLLIFGCRKKSADYFYHDEWAHLKHKMPLQVHTAFSRDQAAKVYVQDIVREHQTEIFHLVDKLGSIVYVCGSSGKMPAAVRAALVDVFRDCGSIGQAEAEAYLEQLEKKGRYRQETWG